jgi:hypothetical protein
MSHPTVYPEPRYRGEAGATLRRADKQPELSHASGGGAHYVAIWGVDRRRVRRDARPTPGAGQYSGGVVTHSKVTGILLRLWNECGDVGSRSSASPFRKV